MPEISPNPKINQMLVAEVRSWLEKFRRGQVMLRNGHDTAIMLWYQPDTLPSMRYPTDPRPLCPVWLKVTTAQLLAVALGMEAEPRTPPDIPERTELESLRDENARLRLKLEQIAGIDIWSKP